MTTTERVSFISYLEGLSGAGDRAALAALRRGLGRPPGTAIEMHRFVVPWLKEEGDSWRERVHYLAAALFASHPLLGKASLAGALAQAAATTGSGSVERRFMALLNSHPDDLPEHLRHAVSLVRAKGIALDWHRFFRDLLGWRSPERHVQRRWARDFWGRGGETTGRPGVPAAQTQETVGG